MADGMVDGSLHCQTPSTVSSVNGSTQTPPAMTEEASVLPYIIAEADGAVLIVAAGGVIPIDAVVVADSLLTMTVVEP